jgi:hypothetical protein
MPIERALVRTLASRLSYALLLSALSGVVVPATAARAQNVALMPGTAAQTVFDPAQHRCDGSDMPDVNARAFRDAGGDIVMFALYDSNHALKGPSLDTLTLDCHSALESHFEADPARYDDRSFLTATWTFDGRTVVGLVHHEYHADNHGRCSVKSDLGCWYNSVLDYLSTDSGANFVRAQPLVIASAPFRQDVGQGRHRGFFNPSNIFSDGTYEYFFAATTGWDGQSDGACLFRSATPENSASWRAYDGQSFSVRYAAPRPCAPIGPFVFPVGAVVRERGNGLWLAVFAAKQNAGVYPADGFYYSEGTDPLHWGEPHLLLAGPTLYSDPCTAGPSLIAYPSLIDPAPKGRNFDDVGANPYLYYATIEVADCATGARKLMRQQLSILGNVDRPQ